MIFYLLDYLLLLGSPNSCLGAGDAQEGERLRKKSMGLLFTTWGWWVGEQSWVGWSEG